MCSETLARPKTLFLETFGDNSTLWCSWHKGTWLGAARHRHHWITIVQRVVQSVLCGLHSLKAAWHHWKMTRDLENLRQAQLPEMWNLFGNLCTRIIKEQSAVLLPLSICHTEQSRHANMWFEHVPCCRQVCPPAANPEADVTQCRSMLVTTRPSCQASLLMMKLV